MRMRISVMTMNVKHVRGRVHLYAYAYAYALHTPVAAALSRRPPGLRGATTQRTHHTIINERNQYLSSYLFCYTSNGMA